MRLQTASEMQRRLTLVPEGPWGPSGPFMDRSRERVRERHQSCTAHVHEVGYGVHTDACPAGWKEMTHARAGRAGSSRFTFNAFAAVLSGVAGVTLTDTARCCGEFVSEVHQKG